MLKMKLLLSTILLFFATLSFAVEPNSANAELTQLLSNITTMQSNFVQFSLGTKRSGAQQKTYGKMYLERPGKFHWETTKPTKQLIIADGKYAWIYDADLEQVTKRKIDYHEAGNPAMLLSGSIDALQSTFKITQLESEGETTSFQLQPKSANNFYKWIQLNFTNGSITSMIMADNLGQQSEIDFSNVKTNNSLAASLFKFTPPEGVDVIDNM